MPKTTPRQLTLVDDGATVWRGKIVSVKERKRNTARAKEWREKNPEKFKAARDAWMALNKDRTSQKKREYYERNRNTINARHKLEYQRRKAQGKVNPHATRLRLKYGMTVEDYDLLMEAQNGQCAICGATSSKSRHRKLVVDHCHATGVVRGLLCDDCNVGIGRLRDVGAMVQRAADYLHAFEHRQAGKRIA